MSDVEGMQCVVEAIRNGRGRSRLYRWLRSRHDQMQAALDDERADWKALAVTFAELGLGGTAERPMKPETARHCWYRVRKAVAAARAKRQGRAKSVQLPMPAAPVPPAPAATAGDALAELRAELNRRSGRA